MTAESTPFFIHGIPDYVPGTTTNYRPVTEPIALVPKAPEPKPPSKATSAQYSYTDVMWLKKIATMKAPGHTAYALASKRGQSFYALCTCDWKSSRNPIATKRGVLQSLRMHIEYDTKPEVREQTQWAQLNSLEKRKNKGEQPL